HTFPVIGRRVMLLNARKLQAGQHGELLVLAMEDVTARKQAEEALLKAGALQSAIFNSANFSSIATDEKGVIQIFNVGAERMLGYAAADVMNKITPADISDPQEVIARAKALSAELGTLITPGFEALVFKASRGIEDIYELTYIRKDGSRFPAVVSVTALRDERDVAPEGRRRIIGYLLIGTDNTARTRIEAERQKLDQRLRDQQFYTRSLIESNIDALMTTDPLGIITDVNKQMEALTGCTRDELIGAPFKNYFTDPERAEAAIKLVLSEKKVTNYELTARARDGKTTVVSYNATTFYDRDRILQGVFAAARDVTERKHFEQALQETNDREQALRAAAEQATQSKDRFLAVLSHELRSPLQSMLGWVRMLRSGRLSVTSTERALDVIERNTVLQARLIEDLLDVSRITAGVLQLDLAPMLVAPAVQTVIENLRPAAAAKGIRLGVSIQDGTGRIQGDTARVQQIVGNLVSNAMKFTPSGGRIAVRIARSGSDVEIQVSDTGAGISSEQLPEVFAPFGTEPRKRSHGGLGLGLGIARHLAELHGGALTAASAGRGHGATFTVTLPLTVELPAADEAAVRAAASDPTQGLAGRHVLLVEDNADAREVITLMLEDSGAVVTATETVAAALSELERMTPDVLLSDLSLPGRDGYDLIRTVRALDPARGGSIPAIALTAYASTEDRERVMAAGYQRCLSKPIDIDELVAAIANCC
ncbi:MAG TPA: PAS domain S-box protein, partial [Candidatus Limnocylindria bacterium]